MIQVQNVLNFLHYKGWTLDETTKTHYLMKPPKEVKTSKDTRLHLVVERLKHTSDYQENMRSITKSIAVMYDLDYYMLEELFSKSIHEIKKYNEVTDVLLTKAA